MCYLFCWFKLQQMYLKEIKKCRATFIIFLKSLKISNKLFQLNPKKGDNRFDYPLYQYDYLISLFWHW